MLFYKNFTSEVFDHHKVSSILWIVNYCFWSAIFFNQRIPFVPQLTKFFRTTQYHRSNSVNSEYLVLFRAVRMSLWLTVYYCLKRVPKFKFLPVRILWLNSIKLIAGRNVINFLHGQVNSFFGRDRELCVAHYGRYSSEEGDKCN